MLRTTNLGDSGAIIIRPSPEPEHMRSSRSSMDMFGNGGSTTGSRATDASLAEFHVPFRTTDLQHYFNAPYQLSVLPPPMRNDPTNIVDSPADAVTEHFGPSDEFGDPFATESDPQLTAAANGDVDEKEGESYKIPRGIREGDVIVLGTDGVWDNLWEEEIHVRLRQALGGLGKGWIACEEDAFYGTSEDDEDFLGMPGAFAPRADPASTHGFVMGGKDPGRQACERLKEIDRRLEKVARQLCLDARIAARNARKPSPFSRNARKAGHLHFGGWVLAKELQGKVYRIWLLTFLRFLFSRKLDDVTVILAYVAKTPHPAAEAEELSSQTPTPSQPSTPPNKVSASPVIQNSNM